MEKVTFNIQIHLSEQQLKKLCELDGFADFENLESYYEMARCNPSRVYDDDPSFSNSIGANINDILSIGFAAMNKMENYGKVQLSKEDLHYHPFRITYPEFTKVEFKSIPFKNNSMYEPIGFVINKQSLK